MPERSPQHPRPDRTPGDRHRSPDARTLRRVLAAFGIDEPASVKRLSVGAGPASKFIVRTASGEPIFLKQRKRTDDAVTEVLRRHRVVAALADAGLPVAEPLRTIDGGSALLGERSVYELARFIDASPWPATARAANAAGGALADLHRSLATAQRMADGWFRPASGLLAGDGPTVSREARCGGAGSPHEENNGFLAQTAAEAAARAATAGLPGRESQLIHGDFHPGNTRWHADQLAAVLDFDACRMGHPIEEAALASVHFAIDRRATTMAVRDPRPDPALIEAFWAGYADLGVGIGHASATADAVPWIAAGSLAIETLRGIANGALDRETVAYGSRVVAWLSEHADGLGTLIARSIAAPNGPSRGRPEPKQG